MTASTLQVVEQVILKKKKLNKSKNRKKTWRKHIDLSSIEACLDQQEEEERLGCLGEDTSNLLFLDTGNEITEFSKENEPEEEKEKDVKLPITLEYTVDPKTGLKATDRPKSDKLIPEHRLLAGLPGSKGPLKKSRFRERDTYLHQLKQKELHKNNPRTAHKALVKADKKYHTTKASRKVKKTLHKLSFDANLWSEKQEPSKEDDLSAAAIDHMQLSMGLKPINNRSSKLKSKKIPAVILPHPGLSYNPDLKSHQNLLAKAVKSELGRSKQAKFINDMRTRDFPKGGEIVSNVETIKDMEAEHPHTPAIKEEPMSDDDGSVPASARKKDRRTHSQRLKYRRHQEALRLARSIKDKKKRENAIFRLKEITKELDEMEEKKKRIDDKKARAQKKKAFKPPKTFEEKDVEVALSSELRSNLRTVQPTSNPVLDRYTHLYRRGMLYSHARTRVYHRENPCNHLRKVVKRPGFQKFSEADFEGPHDVTARLMKRAPKKIK